MKRSDTSVLNPTTHLQPTGIRLQASKVSLMKTLVFSTAAVLSTLTLFATAPANADSGYDQYRRAVLGDTTVSAAVDRATSGAGRASGSNAQYLILINDGPAKPEAEFAGAAHAAETAPYRAAAVIAQQSHMAAAQAYAKYLSKYGNAPAGNGSVLNGE